MVSILSLIFLEIILSIDNLIFLSSITSNLDKSLKNLARFIGLSFALGLRLGFLFLIKYFFNLENNVFKIFDMDVTYREIIFFVGGFFLIYKSGKEIFNIVFPFSNCEKEERPIFIKNANKSNKKEMYKLFFLIVLEIILVDFVFSIDSILVAIALAPSFEVITIATIISMLTLFVSINFLTKILIKFPSMKLLSMCFILLVGCIFILDSVEIYIPKSYINSALIFAIIFESFDIMRINNLNKNKIKNY